MKEILCPITCSYLEQGLQHQLGRETTQNKKEIAHKAKKAFPTQKDDIFNNSRVATELAAPLENFLITRFYNDTEVNDDDIFNTLFKIYTFFTQENVNLVLDKPHEQEIYQKLTEIFNGSSLVQPIKNLLLLRILWSIESLSGGIFGNRNYLKIIHGQFTRGLPGRMSNAALLHHFGDAGDNDDADSMILPEGTELVDEHGNIYTL